MANSDAVLFFAALEGRTNYLQTLLKAAFSVLEKYSMTTAPSGLGKMLDIYMQTWFTVSYVKMYITKYYFIFVLLFLYFNSQYEYSRCMYFYLIYFHFEY